LSAAGKNKTERSKGQNAGRRRVAGREWRRGAWQTRFIVWHDTGASVRATAWAAAKRRPPREGRSGNKMAEPSADRWNRVLLYELSTQPEHSYEESSEEEIPFVSTDSQPSECRSRSGISRTPAAHNPLCHNFRLARDSL